MPTAVEYEPEEMGEGSVHPQDLPEPRMNPGGENLSPEPHMQPGASRGLNFARIGALIGLLFLLLFGFGLFGPPALMTDAALFLVGRDDWNNQACPPGPSLSNHPGLVTQGGTLLPAVQGGTPSFFHVVMFDTFTGLNRLRVGLGGEGFLPPSPCFAGAPPGQNTGDSGGGGVQGRGACLDSCDPNNAGDCQAGLACLPKSAGSDVYICWNRVICNPQPTPAPTPQPTQATSTGSSSQPSDPCASATCGDGVCSICPVDQGCTQDCQPQPVCTCVCDQRDAATGACAAGHDTCTGAACVP